MKNTQTNVIVVIGAGLIGQAIARRVSAGKHVVLADLRQENADTAAKILSDAGFIPADSSNANASALTSNISTDRTAEKVLRGDD